MLTLPGRSLVLVAGIPGAGKSSLLRRLPADREGLAVLDSDPVRDWLRDRLPEGTAYSRYRWLVHLWHRMRIVLLAFGLVGPLVVHLPATGAATRAAVLALAVLAARRPFLVWIDVDPGQARAGQLGRGRVLGQACFDRHARRGEAFAAALRNGRVPRGWDGVTVLDRAAAARGIVLASG